MTNILRLSLIVLAAAAVGLFAQPRLGGIDQGFDFHMTADWSAPEHRDRWQPVVAEDAMEGTTMDDVFHAALGPQRTASAGDVQR